MRDSGISQANAQAETPTPTNENLFNTATVAPTLGGGCPVGNPNGWGSITPDYQWLDKCSQCITRTPFYTWPTLTPDPLVTPTTTPVPPTQTVTPSPTPSGAGLQILNTSGSPIPTYTNVDMVDNQSYNTYKTYSHYSDVNTYNMRISMRSSGSSGSSYTVGYILSNASYYPSGAYNIVQVLKFQNLSNGYITLTFASDSYKNAGVVKALAPNEQYNVYWLNTSGYGAQNLTGTAPIKFNAVVLNSKGIGVTDMSLIVDGAGDVGNDGSRRWDVTFKVIRGGYQNINPTQTPTVSSFCNSVKPAVSMDNQTYFTLPNITVGWSRCIQLGGWTIPMGWITVFEMDDITIPGFQICVKPIYFGSFYMFGLSINLDLLAVIMGGIFLIRLVTRS